MNKRVKKILMYGLVGSISFWAGILLYNYFITKEKNTQEITLNTNYPTSSKNLTDIYASEIQLFKGMFFYKADANILKICATGNSYPIAMVDKYIQLEEKYLDLNPDGKSVFVVLKGRFEKTKAMEGSGTETSIILEEVLQIDPNQSCEAR